MIRSSRVLALCRKEVVQLARDRATLGMLLGVPLVQVLLFGFAIELTPHMLPVTVVAHSSAAAARVSRWLESDVSGAAVRLADSASAARELLVRGETLVTIDMDQRPAQVVVDGSDPVMASIALAAIDRFTHGLADPYAGLAEENPIVKVQTVFNPRLRTQPYLVSGLLGLILTMTMVMMSALSVARERERGTLEGLIELRVRPFELALGKLTPYLALGFVQSAVVLLLARFAFGISIQGYLPLLGIAVAIFASANLALGFLFSTLAPSQMAAMQLTFFFFLPSSLLSGFMFPFAAMPAWARTFGELLPLTHFLRIVRGIVMRGAGVAELGREYAAIILIWLLVAAASWWSCRRALLGARFNHQRSSS